MSLMQRRLEGGGCSGAQALDNAAAARAIDAVMMAGLFFLVVFTPLAFGSVEVWACTVMELTVLALVALYLMKSVALDGCVRIAWTPVNVSVIAFILLVCFQLTPLPAVLLKAVSPQAHGIYAATHEAAGPAAQGALRLSGTLSLYPYATRTELVKILSYTGVFFLITGNVTTEKAGERLLAAIVITGFLIAVFGIIQHFTWNGRLYWTRELTQGGGPFGPFVNKNNFAGYIVMIIPLSLGMLMAERDKGLKALFGFMALVMATALFLSLSRGGMFAFFGAMASMGALLFMASYGGGRKKGIFLIVAFLAPLLLYLLYIGIDPVVDRLSTLGARETYSMEGRWAVWGATAAIIRDYPLFGAGLDTFEAVFPMYRPLEASNLHWLDAHNDYLQFMAETGIAGVVIALTFFVLIFKKAFSALGGDGLAAPAHNYLLIGLVSSAVGFLLSIMFTFNTHIPANALLFAVILAMVVKAGCGMSNGRERRSA